MHRRRYKTSAGKVDFLLGDEKVVIEVKLNRKGRKVEKRYGNYATLYMDYIAEERFFKSHFPLHIHTHFSPAGDSYPCDTGKCGL